MESIAPTTQRPASSGSDVDRYAQFDERKRKRMISNRESARRSRMRKQQHSENLLTEVSRLQAENGVLNQRIEQLDQMYAGAMAQKNVSIAQAMELTDRLCSLNTVLEIVAEANGINVEIPEVHNSSLEPWQLPFPTLPINASSDLVNF
ncbi:DNA-binding transcription factor [Lithospermum erythrorhizon]|uniref:DNA-binding transcription factor n=1 Tax=Lithospermum erythrorhizon TaxID=34254 RepID=A0AAV3NHX5_LITER